MGIHLGKIIEEKMNEKGIKPAFFAEKINTSVRNLYTIFNREDFKTSQLLEISKALDHDFFQYLRPSKKYPKPSGGASIAAEEFLEFSDKAHPKVKVTVEINGDDKNLEHWINLLTDFNKTIRNKYATKYMIV